LTVFRRAPYAALDVNLKSLPAVKDPRPALAGDTLKALAKRSGLSATTLSRVMNHPEMVRPELRARAQAALAEAGYVPNGAARSLASRRTRTMGAVVPTVDSALFARIVDGMQQAIHDQGFLLLLASSNYSPQREAAEVRALLERRVDGLMLVGRSRLPQVYEMLASRGVPFVTTCHYDDTMPWPIVGWDNVAESARIARYLLDIGHRRFGVIAGITADNDRAADRVVGYRAALAERGVQLDPSCVIECAYTVPEARNAMAALMRMPQPPTAVMCGNDILAYGALLECLWRGIRVPEDVSITGFDNIDMAAHCRPGITTLHVPSFAIGERAAEVLLAGGQDVPGTAPRHVFMELELIVRGSTMPPGTAGKAAASVQRAVSA
jgi:LacI family transcriptional regulator